MSNPGFTQCVVVAVVSAIGLAGAQQGLSTQGKESSANQNYTFDTSGELQIVGSETNYDIILPTDVLFDFDKAELRPEAMKLLDKVKAHFATNKASQIHVKGHTDSKGSDQHNFVLSQKRAISVCNWMKQNIGGYNMCIGRGEAEPLVPNENGDGTDNPVNRQKNRRVTISVVKYPDVNKMMNEAGAKAKAARDRLQKK